MANPEVQDYVIVLDQEGTADIMTEIRRRYGSTGLRPGVHLSDLLYCLRKAWAKRRIPEQDQEAIDDELMLTWAGGLIFEDLIATGERQKSAAYCFKCQNVSRVVHGVGGSPEPVRCHHCEEPWLLFTPDYIDSSGLLHEVKQTRKSQSRGPESAAWWIDQLRSYLVFSRKAGWTQEQQAKLVVNWLMGSYGSRKKGKRPIPPRSSIEKFSVVFEEGFEQPWIDELYRRFKIVLSPSIPELSGMSRTDTRSPAWDWECSSCPVGRQIGCEKFIWDEEDNEIGSDPADDTGETISTED